MQPKPLSKIRIESNADDKKKKTLVERKGDWSCVRCKNLNFAFRHECNRCKHPKKDLFNEDNQMMMPLNYNPYPYPNSNPGFNFIDYQNMINGNISVYNNLNNQGMIYPNVPNMNQMHPNMMNKMLYPNTNFNLNPNLSSNSQMGNFPQTSSKQYSSNHQPYFNKKQKKIYDKKSNPNQMHQMAQMMFHEERNNTEDNYDNEHDNNDDNNADLFDSDNSD